MKIQTIQDRVLERAGTKLTERGYSLALTKDGVDNTGTLYVFSEAASDDFVGVPCGVIDFDFQANYYSLTLKVNGVRIPSQEGRVNYFEFVQKYTEPSRFWSELDKHLPAFSDLAPAIRWVKPLRPVGDGSDPFVKLLGHVTIGGVDFHVEAVEVEYNSETEQVSKQDSDSNYFEEFMQIVGGAAQTVEIGGREYLIGITPYQR